MRQMQSGQSDSGYVVCVRFDRPVVGPFRHIEDAIPHWSAGRSLRYIGVDGVVRPVSDADYDRANELAQRAPAPEARTVTPSGQSDIERERNEEMWQEFLDRFDGDGPGRWTFDGERLSDEIAEPLLCLTDNMNHLGDAYA